MRQRQEVQTLSWQAELSLLPTLAEDGGGVVILDQTRLPHEAAFVRLTTLADVARAIRTMQVRGAPLIGATAAYGVALGVQEGRTFDDIFTTLSATRPTAVNLHWALARMRAVLEKSALAVRRGVSQSEAAWNEARAIAREDAEANAVIGQRGLELLKPIVERKGRINIMTHCNAGRLATVAYGTALAPVYAARNANLDVHVWVSETRPRNQGLLTAWELREAGVPHTLIADNAAGLLLMRGEVDAVLVGADRIAANGDVVNKVGTYLKALAAKADGVPFLVAAPLSTVDFAVASGADVPLEERAAEELGEDARFAEKVANPAFDVTPAALVSTLISECGCIKPSELAAWRG